MQTAFLIIQIILSIALISVILVQSSKGGLGTAFGGGGEFRTKRGAERILFRFTILLALLFFIISVVNLLIR